MQPMVGRASDASVTRLPAGVAAGVRSEISTLEAMLVHRPGNELRAGAPGAVDDARLRTCHDALVAELADRGVNVYSVADLLAETIAVSGAARVQGIAAAVSQRRLGLELAAEVAAVLRRQTASALAGILIGGMTFSQLPSSGAAADAQSLVRRMHHADDFAIHPLPGLTFVRDSSLWIGPRFVITSSTSRVRERESSVVDLIYAHHPMFAGTRRAYDSQIAPVEGGDVLLLAPGVIAVGVSERTTPAGAESLARSLFDDGLARTVLAVPLPGDRTSARLDMRCAVVADDALLLDAYLRHDALAYPLHVADGRVQFGEETSFVAAAADALGVERLRLIESVGGSGAHGNVLALEPGVVVAFDTTPDDNGRLIDAGIEVVEVPGCESPRGGPRSLVCPIVRGG